MARSLRPLTVYPITTRTLEVLRVADVTPGMRRVTLGGPELAAAGLGTPERTTIGWGHTLYALAPEA
ncbi:MAG: hypothetical protein QM602_01985 [Microbacterium sp.]